MSPYRLAQIETGEGRAVIAAFDGSRYHRLRDVASTYDLALRAIAEGRPLQDLARNLAADAPFDPAGARWRAPLEHPDPAHCFVTGTGLTHLGSADTRDRMHQSLSEAAALTDSMKMFKLGLEGGKPAGGGPGVQPEWFYKGDGSCLVAPDAPLSMPDFSLDGGEEPEIAGLYVIGPDGTPFRLGFALGNEFSDHVTERQNYLYLAHSKLRPCSAGPEILLGGLPDDIRGTSRILRDGAAIWEKPFLSGEAHMSHTIANLEHHHFKYAMFRRPGDVHLHFFGTATLSFADGVRAEIGDVFEISADPFGQPLRNPLGRSDAPKTAMAIL